MMTVEIFLVVNDVSILQDVVIVPYAVNENGAGLTEVTPTPPHDMVVSPQGKGLVMN